MDPKEFDEMETEEEVETDDDEEEEEEETVKVGNRPFNTRAYVNSFIKVIDTTKAKKHTPDAGIDRILQVHDHMLSVQDFDASRKQYGVGSWDSIRQRYMKMTDKKESEFDGQLLEALARRVENPKERQQGLQDVVARGRCCLYYKPEKQRKPQKGGVAKDLPIPKPSADVYDLLVAIQAICQFETWKELMFFFRQYFYFSKKVLENVPFLQGDAVDKFLAIGSQLPAELMSMTPGLAPQQQPGAYGPLVPSAASQHAYHAMVPYQQAALGPGTFAGLPAGLTNLNITIGDTIHNNAPAAAGTGGSSMAGTGSGIQDSDIHAFMQKQSEGMQKQSEGIEKLLAGQDELKKATTGKKMERPRQVAEDILYAAKTNRRNLAGDFDAVGTKSKERKLPARSNSLDSFVSPDKENTGRRVQFAQFTKAPDIPKAPAMATNTPKTVTENDGEFSEATTPSAKEVPDVVPVLSGSTESPSGGSGSSGSFHSAAETAVEHTGAPRVGGSSEGSPSAAGGSPIASPKKTPDDKSKAKTPAGGRIAGFFGSLWSGKKKGSPPSLAIEFDGSPLIGKGKVRPSDAASDITSPTGARRTSGASELSSIVGSPPKVEVLAPGGHCDSDVGLPPKVASSGTPAMVEKKKKGDHRGNTLLVPETGGLFASPSQPMKDPLAAPEDMTKVQDKGPLLALPKPGVVSTLMGSSHTPAPTMVSELDDFVVVPGKDEEEEVEEEEVVSHAKDDPLERPPPKGDFVLQPRHQKIGVGAIVMITSQDYRGKYGLVLEKSPRGWRVCVLNKINKEDGPTGYFEKRDVETKKSPKSLTLQWLLQDIMLRKDEPNNESDDELMDPEPEDAGCLPLSTLRSRRLSKKNLDKKKKNPQE